MTYDHDADAMYLTLKKGKVFKTIPLGNDKFVDINENGEMIGMEILHNSKNTPTEFNEILRRTKEIKISA